MLSFLLATRTTTSKILPTIPAILEAFDTLKLIRNKPEPQQWLAYFPRLKDYEGPFPTEAEARDAAGPLGLVLRPFKPGDSMTPTRMSPDLIEHWLRELERPAKTLSSWELQFLESVSDQFLRTHRLSEKQFEILEKVYAEKTA